MGIEIVLASASAPDTAIPVTGWLHLATARPGPHDTWVWACRCGQTLGDYESQEQARIAADGHLAGANSAPSACIQCGTPVCLETSGTDEFICSHLCATCLTGPMPSLAPTEVALQR